VIQNEKKKRIREARPPPHLISMYMAGRPETNWDGLGRTAGRQGARGLQYAQPCSFRLAALLLFASFN